ncbi:hypothetical protein CLH62_19645 [Marinobacter guineae]|uniref:Uncharacterized protein n=1 Tax=Marinobacter guineae TaxID=432303 RepID=A0A2G1VAA2_9GAMM|nr:hypothetical protein [Marinobacter guineae]PHQ23686.1 hypothetical protein CLH62_19645 [Marinobacter guineae]
MWLVGQYLRTAKQLDDSSNYEAIQAGLSDVKESIRKLHEIHGTKTQKAATSNSFLVDAKKAVADGHVVAGLMQAGVAFEQAVINKAIQLKLYRGPRVPVAKTINGFRRFMSEPVIDELFAVWKLRNQLVHMSPEAADELANSPELIDYFEWAISELEKSPSNQ